jgi:DNA segregation ATPase FtsK/SpoIIIE, S-DNA-T family
MAAITTAEPADPASVPVGPTLSAYDPIYLGLDEFGHPVYVPMIYRNILLGGEPGAGKSSLLNTFVGHFALCADTRLCLFDGKLVELGLWRDAADVFVGPDLDHANRTLARLQRVMDNRYAYLLARKRRKIVRADGMNVIVVPIDELACYSATFGDKPERELFSTRLRDLVARGRAVGIIVIAATQRPSWDIIPASLRDLFAWRFAGRCTTDASSDVVLGHGWASRGWTANAIAPEDQGQGLLIAEGGLPRLVKAAYLTDTDIIRLAAYARWIRRPSGLTTPTPTRSSVPTAKAA